MRRFTGPGWRLAGSALSWIVFTFSFASLYQVASIVSGLGGFCASGGPYVIETECPESVVLFAPLSVFGLFIATGIGFFLARGFGTPLIVWGWPILFVGLGWQFILSGLQGSITGWVVGILFVVMGAAPLVFELRAGPRRVFVGRTDVFDRQFEERENAPRTVYVLSRIREGEQVAATPASWALSLGVLLVSIAIGLYLSSAAFAAAAGG
jgi:hypothetical protein